MPTVVRDPVAEMVRQGMTLAQVHAANPTQDYDKRHGATSGFWTTEQFVVPFIGASAVALAVETI